MFPPDEPWSRDRLRCTIERCIRTAQENAQSIRHMAAPPPAKGPGRAFRDPATRFCLMKTDADPKAWMRLQRRSESTRSIMDRLQVARAARPALRAWALFDSDSR